MINKSRFISKTSFSTTLIKVTVKNSFQIGNGLLSALIQIPESQLDSRVITIQRETPMNHAFHRMRPYLLASALLLASISAPTLASTKSAEKCTPHLGNAFLRHCQTWATGIEGQRKADLGNGTFLNPIMAGDHPDPSVLKDGDDYYMTFSSFEAYPALTIWHSKDLVNWEPIGAALQQYVGSIWAPELTKHNGRFYLYIPAKFPGNNNIYVIHADNIRGPWSAPVVLNNDRIDPGHIVGEDGKRYLFLSHGDRVQLADDGLSIVGKMEHIYDGWQYPEEWDVESYAQEGPKMMKHGDYYYMTLALGGTAGPPGFSLQSRLLNLKLCNYLRL